MKSTKQLWTLLIVAVLLGGIYLLNTRSIRKNNGDRERNKPVLAGVNLDTVAHITITSGGQSFELAQHDGQWVVPSLDGYPADFDRIREHLLRLADVKVGDIVHGMALDATTDLLLADASGNALITLHLGKVRQRAQQAGGMMWQPPEGRYLRVNDRDDVYLVKEGLQEFTPDARAWIKTEILAIPAADVQLVDVTPAGGQPFAFVRTDGALEMQDLKDGETFDTSKRHQLENAFSYLRFDKVEKRGGNAFTNATQFAVTLEDGEKITALIGVPAADGSRPVRLESTGAERNAQLAPWQFTIPSHTADNLARARDEYLKQPEPAATVESEPVEIPVPVAEPTPLPQDETEIPAPVAEPTPVPQDETTEGELPAPHP